MPKETDNEYTRPGTNLGVKIRAVHEALRKVNQKQTKRWSVCEAHSEASLKRLSAREARSEVSLQRDKGNGRDMRRRSDRDARVVASMRGRGCENVRDNERGRAGVRSVRVARAPHMLTLHLHLPAFGCQPPPSPANGWWPWAPRSLGPQNCRSRVGGVGPRRRITRCRRVRPHRPPAAR